MHRPYPSAPKNESAHAQPARVGNLVTAYRHRKERAYLFAEARHLIACGASPADIAAQLQTTPAALARRAYRWHAPDIGRYLEAARNRPDKEAS